MAVSEIKKWTVILVFVGLILSIGGSWSIALERSRANEEDIACVRRDVKDLEDYSHALRNDISEIHASTAVMENDLAWIKQTLTEMNQ